MKGLKTECPVLIYGGLCLANDDISCKDCQNAFHSSEVKEAKK